MNGGDEESVEIDELPKSIVRRIVKDKLSQLTSDFELSVQREALTGFSESARIFIHYLSATANDICKEAKRQTINAEDVFKAIEEMEYLEFQGILRASLQELRKNNLKKRSGSLKANESEDKGRKNESPARNRDEEEPEKDDILEAEKDDILEAEKGDVLEGDILDAETGDILEAEKGDIVEAEKGDSVEAENPDGEDNSIDREDATLET